jgi:hypothetical protein
MAEQQNNGGDPIDRALIRAHGIAGSPLEKAIRLNAYKLIDTGDGTKTDANLDNFVLEQRADPFYASSFATPPAGATVTSKATVVPNEQERAAIATSGKVSGVPTSTKAKPKDWSQTDIVQLPPEDFESIRTGKKSFVG